MGALTSRQNKLVQRWRELSLEGKARKRERAALLEGAHLVTAALNAGVPVRQLILSPKGQGKPEHASAVRHFGRDPLVVSDSVFGFISDTESPAGIAAEIEIPAAKPDLAASAGCIFLESVQDPGNVGGILRSAAAFGIRDAVLGQGCADPWSPKALRAAMGAHFSLRIAPDADLEKVVGTFGGTLVCTAPREGTPIAQAELPARIGWIFGTEGKGVTRSLAARAALKVTIPMAGLAESLNVGAAAAICFYEASRRSGR
ncbi:MAG TPA: RNA methyltransferase [Burkholderiales bacterium]|jgi:TrmH family RNA methyltransferase|nr:RNA methyltransferase [Burkholderiales bacterium]